MHPSPRSLRGLDWFIFFVADVQTGFGPFVSVYLTTQHWTQFDIGLVLSVAGIVSLLGQMPGGALVDAARSERFVAGVAIVAICVSALDLCGVADLPGRADRRGPARAGELRARPGHRRDQPRPRRPRRDRRAARPQRPLRLGRQRLRGGGDGRLRLSPVRARGVLRHRAAARAGAAGAAHALRRRRSIPNAPTARCRAVAPTSRGPTPRRCCATGRC